MTAGENASFCRKIFRLHLISQWGCTSAGFFPDFSPRFLYSRFPDSGVNNVSKPTGESCVCHWCWQLDLKEARQDIWEPWLSSSYLWSPVLALVWCQVSQMFHLFQTNLPLTKFSSYQRCFDLIVTTIWSLFIWSDLKTCRSQAALLKGK